MSAKPSAVCLPFTPGVAGVDEAGRGPIAGPVVVAAVIIPEGYDPTGFQDSKKLASSQRQILAEQIRQDLVHAVRLVPAHVIDHHNILRATLLAMADCLRELAPASAIVDGNQLPPDLPCPAQTLVKGDAKDAAVAAASILAKVTRDNHMVELDQEFPGYGFAANKGYGTDAIARLRELGPTPYHRRSFEPLKSMESQPCLTLGI